MQHALLQLVFRARVYLLHEEAQDLVEYALVIALIALGATAGMSTLASDINNAFMQIGNMLVTLST